MNNGWIKLYRKIRDSKFWKDKPFSKGQAWIDLLFDVNFKTTKTIYKKKYLQIKPGRLFISQRKYAKKWGWSKTKTRDYFQTLENLDQIQTIKKTTIGTLIMVINWGLYQSGEILKDHQKDLKKTTKRPLKDHPRIDTNMETEASKDMRGLARKLRTKNVKNVKNKPNTTKSSLQESNINHLMTIYQKKFPEQRKLYGMGGVIRVRDYFEEIIKSGFTHKEIEIAINKANDSAPWNIIKPKKPESPLKRALREKKEDDYK